MSTYTRPNVPGEFIVELEDGVWLNGSPGDPGRTLVKSSARGYDTIKGARIALTLARRYHPFKDAKLREVERRKTEAFTCGACGTPLPPNGSPCSTCEGEIVERTPLGGAAIYGIEGQGNDVEEIVRFPASQREGAYAWATGETLRGEDFVTVEGRRIFRAPPRFKLPKDKPASNPLRHLAEAIESGCELIETGGAP